MRIEGARTGDVTAMPSLLRTLGSIPEAILGIADDVCRAAGMLPALDAHLRAA